MPVMDQFAGWNIKDEFSGITYIDLFLFLKAALQTSEPFQIGKAHTKIKLGCAHSCVTRFLSSKPEPLAHPDVESVWTWPELELEHNGMNQNHL